MVSDVKLEGEVWYCIVLIGIVVDCLTNMSELEYLTDEFWMSLGNGVDAYIVNTLFCMEEVLSTVD